MFVGSLWLEVQIPGARSLKEKRQVLSGLINRLRARYPVSVAEVGGQDTWQRAEIGVAVVSGDAGQARHVIERVRQHVEGEPGTVVCGAETQLY